MTRLPNKAEKARIIGLISSILTTSHPTGTPRDNYYRDVLEGVMTTLEEAYVTDDGELSLIRLPNMGLTLAVRAEEQPPAA
jgi:hypothetical protein